MTVLSAPDNRDNAVGDVAPTVEGSPVHRRHFGQYAGASGEFNHIHYGETYATFRGHKSGFA